MPEGDTVHKIASALAPDLVGRTLVRARIPRAPGAGLDGRRVTGVWAEGKHLWIGLDDGRAVRSHLGLSGTWHRYRPGEPWQRPAHRAGLVLETAEAVLVCFHPRKVEVVPASGPRARDLRASAGPDLLAPGTDPAGPPARARVLCAPGDPVADVLLDQRVASGIGNVYKCEVLFLEGVAPDRPLARVPDPLLERLYARAQALLRRNLGRGPRTTRFEGDGRGRLWVYGRAGRPCLRCGTPIRAGRLGRNLRITYWCPRCQVSGD